MESDVNTKDSGAFDYLEALIRRCGERCGVDTSGMYASEVLDALAERWQGRERELQHAKDRVQEIEIERLMRDG